MRRQPRLVSKKTLIKKIQAYIKSFSLTAWIMDFIHSMAWAAMHISFSIIVAIAFLLIFNMFGFIVRPIAHAMLVRMSLLMSCAYAYGIALLISLLQRSNLDRRVIDFLSGLLGALLVAPMLFWG